MTQDSKALELIPVYADETLEDLQRGGYRLIQSSYGFRHGTDSVLLAAYAAARLEKQKRNLSIADLGAGNGAVSILLAARLPQVRIAAFEKDPHSSDLLRRNIQLNQLQRRMDQLAGDLRDRVTEAHLADHVPDYNQYDVVVANPPYHVPEQSYGGQGTAVNNTVVKNRSAVYEDDLPLEVLLHLARRLLKQRGKLLMVHHPRRLPDLIQQLRQHRFEPLCLRLVHSHIERPPVMILLEARLYGQTGGFQIEKPLLLEQPLGQTSPELSDLYGHEAPMGAEALQRGVYFCRNDWQSMTDKGD